MKIVTWNVLWRFGEWEARQPLIEAELRARDADLCLLQETWPGQAEALASTLGLDVLAFRGGTFDQTLSSVPTDEPFGNAILARPGIAGLAIDHPLAAPGDPAPRNVLAAEVATPGGPCLVATTHLTHMSEAGRLRENQLRAITEVLDATGLPSLLCGDCNMVPSSPEHAAALGMGLIDAWAAQHPDPGTPAEYGGTMTPDNPEISSTQWMNDRNGSAAPIDSGVRLDYVWLRSGSNGSTPRVGTVERFGRGGRRWPSDHLGLTVDLLTHDVERGADHG